MGASHVKQAINQIPHGIYADQDLTEAEIGYLIFTKWFCYGRWKLWDSVHLHRLKWKCKIRMFIITKIKSNDNTYMNMSLVYKMYYKIMTWSDINFLLIVIIKTELRHDQVWLAESDYKIM